MRGIRALLPARLDQAPLHQRGQQHVQHMLFKTASDDPGAELWQHTVIEPGIIQREPERVLPGQIPPRRLRGLPIGQLLRHLQHAHQRKAPRRIQSFGRRCPNGARRWAAGRGRR